MFDFFDFDTNFVTEFDLCLIIFTHIKVDLKALRNDLGISSSKTAALGLSFEKSNTSRIL